MKRIFPWINIFLVTVVIFFGIDSIYKIIAAQLDTFDRPEPIISETSFSPAEIKAPPLSNYRFIAERDIFQTNTADSAAKVEKIFMETIKPTERNLKLWGTVVGNGPASTYAIIEKPGARSHRSNQFLHKAGDVVQGATIKKIMREKVILSANGKNEILHLVERKDVGRYRKSQQPDNQRRSQPIHQKRMLRRTQVQEAIGDISELQSQANIRPHSEGVQISRIRPRSIFRRMGLRNGDIITAAGGRTITSVNEALEIWRNLTTDGEASVEIKRRGRKRIIDYGIR